MHRQYDEDLFENTKMTFGEHLDELRRALIKALSALAAGFLVGLFFAGHLVDYIQTPLRAAMVDYYQNQEAEAGREDLLTETKYVDPHDIFKALRAAFPEFLSETNLPDEIDTTDLIPLRMYHSLEDDRRVRTIGLSMQEPFVVYVKAALVLGVILASPFIFYFLWEFVGAGLYPHEKQYVHLFLPVSLGLFLAGAALAFFFVMDYVLQFLFKFYDWMGIDPTPRITDWLNFALVLPVGFGISFQLPLVMLFLERIGIFSVRVYIAQWRIAVLVICVLSALLTPADPQSMILMAVPLVILYFGGVMLCHFMPRRRTPFGDTIDP